MNRPPTPPTKNDGNDIANEAIINNVPASVNAHARQNSKVGQVINGRDSRIRQSK